MDGNEGGTGAVQIASDPPHPPAMPLSAASSFIIENRLSNIERNTTIQAGQRRGGGTWTEGEREQTQNLGSRGAQVQGAIKKKKSRSRDQKMGYVGVP
jgi:hypothetical protein